MFEKVTQSSADFRESMLATERIIRACCIVGVRCIHLLRTPDEVDDLEKAVEGPPNFTDSRIIFLQQSHVICSRPRFAADRDFLTHGILTMAIANRMQEECRYKDEQKTYREEYIFTEDEGQQ